MFITSDYKKFLLLAESIFKYNFILPIYFKRRTFKNNTLAEWYITIDNTGNMIHHIAIDFNKHASIHALHESILHELIHALQYEEKGLNVAHNDFFLFWAVELEKLGYNIACNNCDLKRLNDFRRVLK